VGKTDTNERKRNAGNQALVIVKLFVYRIHIRCLFVYKHVEMSVVRLVGVPKVLT